MDKPAILANPEAWAVVPVGQTPEMTQAARTANMNIAGGYGGPGAYEAMLAARPSPNALQEVVAYVEGLEAENGRLRNKPKLYCAMLTTGVCDANARANAHWEAADAAEARVKKLEERLSEAEKVIEPFSEAVKRADALAQQDGLGLSCDAFASIWAFSYAQLRAARAWKEGK